MTLIPLESYCFRMNQIGCQDGAAIRRIREERKLSALELAERVGIRRRSLYNIELGNKPAGIDVIVRIARELRIQVDEILKKPGDDAEAEVDGAAAL